MRPQVLVAGPFEMLSSWQKVGEGDEAIIVFEVVCSSAVFWFLGPYLRIPRFSDKIFLAHW